MRITRSADAHPEPMEAENFSGSATRQDLGLIEAPEVGPLVVRFEAGARTNWHRHAHGQIIFVLDGRGRVGVRGGEVAEISPGDLVYAPPGEEHWHGAADDGAMRHLALSFGQTEWIGPVE